jgi:predicted dehydrogenase
MISAHFVADVQRSDWPGKKENHVVQAVAASSLQKCRDFVEEHFTSTNETERPTLYGSYAELYADDSIDCIYVATPHAFHKRICLDAIAAGRNILCEKPLAMNENEAKEIFDAADSKGVFIMEAMWTRFFPLMTELRNSLYQRKDIGTVYRTICDFGLPIDITKLPEGNRYKDPALGAGSLLDIGIYSLTHCLVSLTGDFGETFEDPDVVGFQSLFNGNLGPVDLTTSIVLRWTTTGRQGVAMSTTNFEGSKDFARIDGSQGYIVLTGLSPAKPDYFTIHYRDGTSTRHEFERPGRGIYWELDSVAADLKASRTQNQIMPWEETLRVLRIMDTIRARNGAKFPVD